MDGSTAYPSIQKIIDTYISKTCLINTTFTVEYVMGFETGGNAFVISLSSPYVDKYVQIALAPLSNDYSQWHPVLNIMIRAIDPTSGNYQPWRTI